MTSRTLRLFCISVILCLTAVAAQQLGLEVISLDGEAKVQRSDKKNWMDLGLGLKVGDNDIVETMFQTKLVLAFGGANTIIIGSNSKALINIQERQALDKKILDVSVTLFGGGVFAKAVSASHISIYTSNAVAETQNGSISSVVEPKTQESGFQILGGTVNIRSIAQKEGRDLSAGQTTMILPGREPTAPLYITYRHVTVLKHFFGDDYINNELSASGITPTEDRATRDRMSLAQNLGERAGAGASDEGFFKALFSANRVYGAILTDQTNRARRYRAIDRPEKIVNASTTLGAQFSFGAGGTGFFPAITLTPQFTFSPQLEVSLRLGLAANYTHAIGMYGFSSFAGILDKINYIVLRPLQNDLIIRLGEINDYSLGGGMVVNHFSNRNAYALFTPLGLTARYTWEDFLTVKAFSADISNFAVGGIYAEISQNQYRCGAGFFWDANQYSPLTQDNLRYDTLPTISKNNIVNAPESTALSMSVYQIDGSVDLFSVNNFTLTLAATLAQKLSLPHSDGFVVTLPEFRGEYNGFVLTAGLVTAAGRLVPGQLSAFYMSDRAWIVKPSRFSGAKDTFYTQNSALSEKKMSRALAFALRTNPFKGYALDLSYCWNIADRNALASDSGFRGPDISYMIGVSIDDGVFPKVHWARFAIGQAHAGLYPAGSSPFASWGYNLQLEALTQPLAFNTALTTYLRYYFLDLGAFDNKVHSGDNVFEMGIGLQWGIR
ncbi:MAG: hypothetical protein PHC61_17605 [Chitinivibrionales bacterium]|nr:hypothetical protein [Chitinivibrionales bacterium]